MSRRVEQVESTMLRALQGEIARGLHDPRASGLITVTGIKVTPDLKTAFVMISVLPHDKQDLTMHALRHAARHLRRRIGDALDMADVPELVFRSDESTKEQAKLLEAFAKIRREREDEPGDRQADDAEGRA
ncbi:MAG: 30S ribosome-binding factor RbfA [Phycisphaeraceae bacterium]|nr:30S ribosome-binding factor RbfA [Phycisphaeraceae bacterium]